MRFAVLRSSFALVLSLLCASASATEVTEPSLALAELLPPDSLPEAISVADPVPLRDFLAQFQVSGSGGDYLVEGARSLQLRLREEATLARLRKLTAEPVVADALGKLPPAEVVFDVRVEGMRGRGPARFYRSREDQLVKSLLALQRPMLQKALEPRLNPTLRTLCEKLAIDPYTTHPQLRAELDRLVIAMADDEQLREQVLDLAKGPEQLEAVIDERLWSTAPDVLAQEGIQAMMAMGVAFRASQRFFGNPYVSPTLALAWLEAQAALGPMPGADAMVMLGVAAESEAEIRMLIDQLRWAARFEYQGDRIMAFNVQRQAPTFRTRNNRVVALLPVEYLSWTKAFSEFAERPDMLGSEKLIWITGEASPAALKGLEQTGWKLRTAVKALAEPE